MCECYKIGGPWIAEDPDCPVHGREAQQREAEIADLRAAQAPLLERIKELEKQNAELLKLAIVIESDQSQPEFRRQYARDILASSQQQKGGV